MTGFEWHSPGGGVFWKQFEAHSKKLGDMGITAAWLPRTSLPPRTRRPPRRAHVVAGYLRTSPD